MLSTKKKQQRTFRFQLLHYMWQLDFLLSIENEYVRECIIVYTHNVYTISTRCCLIFHIFYFYGSISPKAGIPVKRQYEGQVRDKVQVRGLLRSFILCTW